MESRPRRHRISVHDYHRMAEVGVLAPDARAELIEGEIIDMAPIGKDHQSIDDQLNRMLVRAVGDRAIVRVQGSIRLDNWPDPRPDVVLLAPRPDFYRSEFALGTDALLLNGALRDGQYERHVALERPASVPVTHLPGVTLDVAPLFAH